MWNGGTECAAYNPTSFGEEFPPVSAKDMDTHGIQNNNVLFCL